MKINKRRANKNIANIPPVIIALGDVFFELAGFLAAFTLWFGADVPDRNFIPFLNSMPWIALATLTIFWGLGLYEQRRNGFIPVLRSTVIGVISVSVITTAVTFWLRGFAFPRSVILIALLIQLLLLSAWKFLCWNLAKKIHGSREILVIAPPNEAQLLLDKFVELPDGWFKIKGIMDPGDLDQLSKQLDETEAVLIVSSLSREDKESIITACQDAECEIFLVPDLYDILLYKTRTTQINDMLVMEIPEMRLTGRQRFVKRSMDIILSLLILIPGSLLMAFCAALVKITSPGPVFYVQRRVGRQGKVFKLYKFRTMVNDAEKTTGPVLATDGDPRVTRIGKVMRTYRLDEFPQLINILKGEMSLVGPRPERPVFVQEYNKEFPDYHYRHFVKPGLTGLAQVLGKYATSPWDKLRYDIYYIRNHSVFLDFKILIQTIPVMFSSESSMGQKKNVTHKKEITRTLSAKLETQNTIRKD